MQIGVIGIGSMGGGMARRLAEKGQKVSCFDTSPERCAVVAKNGLQIAGSAIELASQSDIVILSLPNAAIVDSVIRGQGAIESVLRPGALVLDTSTSDPTTTVQLADILAKRNVAMIDAPVSGGPAAAGSGTMTMLLGGDAEAIKRARPVIDLLAAKTVHVGPSGAGHTAKIANNMLCAANLVLVAEAVRLAEAAGVAATDLLDGINAGSGRSGVSEVNFPRWVINGAFDSGFTMGLMRKDVRLATRLAQQLGVEMPALERIAQLWAESAGALPDDADFNAIAAPRKA